MSNIAKISKNGNFNKEAKDALMALVGEDKEKLAMALNGDEGAMKEVIKKITENGLGEQVNAVNGQEKENDMETKSTNHLKRKLIKVESTLGHLHMVLGTGRRVVDFRWDGRAEGPIVKVVAGPRFIKKHNESTKDFYKRISLEGREKLIQALKTYGIKVTFKDGKVTELTQKEKPQVVAVSGSFGADVEDEFGSL